MDEALKTRPLDYERQGNWIIEESAANIAGLPYDLFYIYPTLTASKNEPLMNLSDKKVYHKTIGFAAAQIERFQHFRAFAPYVRQLEYHRSMAYLRGEANHHSLQAVGMQDAVDAFRYYLKHWNRGRPYILFGHSQGSRNLHHVLQHCREITEANGFIAAYLPGLPAMTDERIQREFSGRGIGPAKGASDLSTIVCWNTQTPDAVKSVYSTPNGTVINPLNWRTDETPATAEENVGAVFYNYREVDPAKRRVRIANFCGAVINCAKGVVEVDLPSNSIWDAHGYVSVGALHMNDVWFFAENVVLNSSVRAEAWLKKHAGEE